MRPRALCGRYTKYLSGCRCRPCRDAHATENRRWLRANKGKVALYNQRKNLKQYGLTIEDYERRSIKQKGLCAICHNPERAGRRLAVDHDHRTTRVRGLLCYSCNTKLGFVEKYQKQITRYLERTS